MLYLFFDKETEKYFRSRVRREMSFDFKPEIINQGLKKLGSDDRLSQKAR
jgi:hypothetical protein